MFVFLETRMPQPSPVSQALLAILILWTHLILATPPEDTEAYEANDNHEQEGSKTGKCNCSIDPAKKSRRSRD